MGALPLAGREIRVEEVGEGRTSFDWRLSAIEARRESFFAFEPRAVRALIVDVVGRKTEM